MMVPMVAWLIQPVASSLINAASGKGVKRAGEGQEVGIIPLLVIPLMIRVLVKGVTRAVRIYNNMNDIDKTF